MIKAVELIEDTDITSLENKINKSLETKGETATVTVIPYIFIEQSGCYNTVYYLAKIEYLT